MKKKILSTILLCLLFLTGCSKLEKIIDILLEDETEIAETDAPAPDAPETPEQPETPAPDAPETPEQPETPAPDAPVAE